MAAGSGVICSHGRLDELHPLPSTQSLDHHAALIWVVTVMVPLTVAPSVGWFITSAHAARAIDSTSDSSTARLVYPISSVAPFPIRRLPVTGIFGHADASQSAPLLGFRRACRKCLARVVARRPKRSTGANPRLIVVPGAAARCFVLVGLFKWRTSVSSGRRTRSP